MEYLVFLVGLGVFAFYGRLLIVIISIGLAISVASNAPRIEALDQLANTPWIALYYLVGMLLFGAGMGRFWSRIWAGVRANDAARADRQAREN
jgi:hypothetical protein